MPPVVCAALLIFIMFADSYLRREPCAKHASELAYGASWQADRNEHLLHKDGIGVGADLDQ